MEVWSEQVGQDLFFWRFFWFWDETFTAFWNYLVWSSLAGSFLELVLGLELANWLIN